MSNYIKNLLIAGAALTIITSCTQGNIKIEHDYPKVEEQRRLDKMRSALNKKGLSISASELKYGKTTKSPHKIKENHILWQAALEEISYMPIHSADYKSKIITTDWYNDKNTQESVKINILFNNEELKVTVFKRIKINNDWKDLGIDKVQADTIKHNIYNKAKYRK